MPRILACLDEVPAQDGTCVLQAWVQQTAWPALPSVEQAADIGGVMLGSLVIIRALITLLKPPKEGDFHE